LLGGSVRGAAGRHQTIVEEFPLSKHFDGIKAVWFFFNNNRAPYLMRR
jgi:hypothetical protein